MNRLDSTRSRTPAHDRRQEETRSARHALTRKAAQQTTERIDEEVEVLGELGRGGMGRVLRVRHRRWNVEMALKMPIGTLPPERVADIVTEADAWMRLGLHAHVVTCLFVRVRGGIPHIFVELVDGGPLSTRAQNASTVELLDWLSQAAAGLTHAHRAGFVHQDIKPGNFLVDGQGVVRLTDFGLSRALHGGKAEVAGATPAFAAPEQLQHNLVTTAADVFSFAASALALLLGERPWAIGPAAHVVINEVICGTRRLEHSVEQPLLEMLAACLSLVPSSRPGIDEVAEVVVRAAARRGAHIPVPRALEPVADGLVNAAVSRLELFHVDAADALLDEALSQDPTHVVARFNRALLDWRLRRLSLAELEQHVAPLLDALPGGSPLYAKAALFDELSFFKLAAKAARAAGAATGDDADLARLCIALAASGDTEGARALLDARPDAKASPLCARVQAEIGADRGKHTRSTIDGRFDSAPLAELLASKSAIRHLAVATDGRSCLVHSGTSVLRVDLDTADTTPVDCAMQAAPESRLNGLPLIAGMDGSISVGEKRFAIHERAVRCVAAVDEHRFVSGGDDGRLLLVDVETGLVDMIWDGHRSPIACVAVVPGRPWILSGGVDGRVCLWGVPLPMRPPGLWLCPPTKTSKLRAYDMEFTKHLGLASAAVERGDHATARTALDAARQVPGYARSPGVSRLRTRLRREGALPVELWEVLRIAVDGLVTSVRVNDDDSRIVITLYDKTALLVSLEASPTRLRAVVEPKRFSALAAGFYGQDLVIVDALGRIARRGQIFSTSMLKFVHGADVGSDGTVGIFGKLEQVERFGDNVARVVSFEHGVVDRLVRKTSPLLGPVVPVRAAHDVLAVGDRSLIDAAGERYLTDDSGLSVPAVSSTRRAFVKSDDTIVLIDQNDRALGQIQGEGVLALDRTGRLLAHGGAESLSVTAVDALEHSVSLHGHFPTDLRSLAFSPSSRFVCCGGNGVVIVCELHCT